MVIEEENKRLEKVVPGETINVYLDQDVPYNVIVITYVIMF